MDISDFEISFATIPLDEKDNLSNIYNNTTYNGWYRLILPDAGLVNVIVWFRLPATMRLYGEILRNFTQKERLVGLHRFLVGKDLQEELQQFLKDANTINDVMENLSDVSDEKVKEILNRLKKMITADFNKIPYLHIRCKLEELEKFEQDIKKHIALYPPFLEILRKVLNEEIAIEDVSRISGGIIYNEIMELKK